MARSRILLGIVAAWVIVVLVGSTAVWAVISQTGKELVPAASPPIQAPAASPTAASPTAPEASLAPRPEPIEQVPPPAPPSPTESSPAASSSSSSAPGEDDHPSSPSDDGHEQTSSTTRGSWTGQGGTVFAECSSRGIRISAISNPGYRAEADTDEGRGRVTFEKTDGEDQEIDVYVVCRSDGPDFYARSDD